MAKKHRGVKTNRINTKYNKSGFYPSQIKSDSIGWCGLHSSYVNKYKCFEKGCKGCEHFITLKRG